MPDAKSPYYLLFTPYQDDAGDALEDLREEAFENGDYTYTASTKAEEIWKMIGWEVADPKSPDGLAELEAQKRVLAAAQMDDLEKLTPDEKDLAQHLQTVIGMLAMTGVKDVQLPMTIETLVEAAGEEGTRSIIDIEKIGKKPGAGVAAGLPSQELWQIFGTTQPSHADVEKHWLQIARRLGRWEAIFVTIYHDSEPQEYAFIGCHGID